MNTSLDNPWSIVLENPVAVACAALVVAVSLYVIFRLKTAVTAPTKQPGEKAQRLARACGDWPIDPFLWQRSHDEILDALVPDEGTRGADLALAHRQLTGEGSPLPSVNAIGLLIAGRCGSTVPKPVVLRGWFLRGLGRRARDLVRFANGDTDSPHAAELSALSEFVGLQVMNLTADEFRAATGCQPEEYGPPAACNAAPRIDRKSMAPIVAAAMSRCDTLADTIRFGSRAFDYKLGLLEKELAAAGATLADVGLGDDRLEKAWRLSLPMMAQCCVHNLKCDHPSESEYRSLVTICKAIGYDVKTYMDPWTVSVCRVAALKYEVGRMRRNARRYTDRVLDVQIYRLVNTALDLSAKGLEIDLHTLVGLMDLALDATRAHLVDLRRAAERHVPGCAEILEEVRAHVGEVHRAIYGEGLAAAA